jgi:ABC-type Fe3+/spermidine/putrescine transport system ATPase subunit
LSAITLTSLTKRFGEVVAVDQLDLQIAEGELIALLGPSGCGKTTTLRMIAGFEPPTGGSIRIGEREVTALPPERRNCGMVFQSYALFPHLTVQENVAFGLEMRGLRRSEIRERTERILEKVGLEDMQDRRPRQLSGGQQQRTALARALVISPAVLLLDEPLANLDAKLREEMRFYIRQLQREFRITTVYVTHDQAEAMVLADRIAVMMRGGLRQLGGPEDLYRRPASAEVADFVGVTNLLPGTVRSVDGTEVVLETAVGLLKAQCGGGMQPGEDCWLSIRPEDLEPGARGPGNCISGTVRAWAFLGNIADCRIEAAGETMLRVQAQPGVRHREGDQVTVSFNPEAAWAMPR